MKKTHITSLALLALIGAGLVAPAAAHADALTHEGTGKIIYEDAKESPDVTDPDDPDRPIDQPEPNPQAGPLMIIGISPLDFGTQEIDTFTSAQEYYAKPFDTTQKELVTNDEDGNPVTLPEEAVTVPNFVQFRDLRGGDNANNWTISANLTKQFIADDGSELDGATLEYTNGKLKNFDSTSEYTPTNTTVGTFGLTEDGGATEVLSQSEAGKGYGNYNIVFGEVADGSAAESIKLTVPANVRLAATEYTAEITWTIADTPAP